MKNRLVIFLSAIFVLFTFGSVSAAPESVECTGDFSLLPEGLGCFMGYAETLDFVIMWKTKPMSVNFKLAHQLVHSPLGVTCPKDLVIQYVGGAILCLRELSDEVIVIQGGGGETIIHGRVPPVVFLPTPAGNPLQLVVTGRFYTSLDGLVPNMYEPDNGAVLGTAKFRVNFWGLTFLAVRDVDGILKFVPIDYMQIKKHVIVALADLDNYIFWNDEGSWYEVPAFIPGALPV